MPPSSGGGAKITLAPGAVYRLDPDLVPMPRLEGPQPDRQHRWVVVISNKRDCRDTWCRTVVVVPLSRGLEHFGRWDVEIKRGDGGTDADVMAQTDLPFFILKEDLLGGDYMGTVLRDTLNRIKATLANTFGLAVALALDEE